LWRIKSPKENQAKPFSLKHCRNYAVRGAGYSNGLGNSMQSTAKEKTEKQSIQMINPKSNAFA